MQNYVFRSPWFAVLYYWQKLLRPLKNDMFCSLKIRRKLFFEKNEFYVHFIHCIQAFTLKCPVHEDFYLKSWKESYLCGHVSSKSIWNIISIFFLFSRLSKISPNYTRSEFSGKTSCFYFFVCWSPNSQTKLLSVLLFPRIVLCLEAFGPFQPKAIHS